MDASHKIKALATTSFIILCALISTLALIQTAIELNKLITARQATPFFYNGLKIAGLNNIIHNKYIGYYTDRDIVKDPKALAQFAQFQHKLAPIILDNTSLNHHFLIIDCDEPKNAFDILQHLKAQALSRNNFNTILAVREGF